MKDRITLFLSGDVMTGRGIDQVLPFPGDPALYEASADTALDYVDLAERAHGSIPRPADFRSVWGDALEEFRRRLPDVKIINLETSVTRNNDPWPDKEVLYRMSPENVPCLAAAGIDGCVLANNHVLDWGVPGLLETLESLDAAGIRRAGAGRNLREAEAPAVLDVRGGGRVVVFALGSVTSGIRSEWAAGEGRPGVNLIEARPDDPVPWLSDRIRGMKREGDVVVVSIHWGSNWGYEIPDSQRDMARRLVDQAGVDVVHGHSSHHVKAMEVYQGRLILYGCGDLLTDYEGIRGHESFGGDLGLLYFPEFVPRSGSLRALHMVPTRMRRFRIVRASEEDSRWLQKVLNREGEPFGTRVERSAENILTLGWDQAHLDPRWIRSTGTTR